tara:strand:+ start:1098 stop:1895 length:798 start_codon:yes stop_codon:yes gene_type:complete
MPDLVSEEFVNVGVIVFQPEHRFLKIQVIDKYRRITQFFDGINGNYLFKTLKHFKSVIDKKANEYTNEVPFRLPESLHTISSETLPNDNSSLYLTEVNLGIDLNLDSAFNKLSKRYIYESLEDSTTYSDKEVWSKIYKPFFEKNGITDSLKEKTIKTSTDVIKFDHAYKNGVWNCIESANFELKHKDSIESKVFKIIGKLDALANSSEDLQYHILAHLNTEDKKNNLYIKKKLQNHKNGKVVINFVTEDDIPEFINRVKTDLHLI